MERYERYKDSGVKWIGEIPEHWEVKRLKYVTNIIFLGKTPKYSLEENAYIIIGQRCNQLDGIKMSDCKYSDEKFYINRKKYEFLNYGDILLNSLGGGSVGRVGYFDLKENGILTDGHIIVIRSNFEYNNRYLYYFLGTKRKDFELMACGSTNQMFLLVSDIYKLFVPVPPKSEQTAIANYLDSVTSKIDEAISQQQKMIDLLNERKQIIIQNAVTKGLDPNAKMKDSGVEWIGEIPEDWEVRPIKTLLKLKKKLVGSNSNKFNLLSLSIDGIKIRDINNPMGKFPSSFDTYQEVNKNDFVFCNFDNEETPRAVGLSKVHGMITGAYDVMELYDLRVDIEYLYLVFLDIDNFKKFKPLYKGLRKTIPYDSFMSYKIAIPPLNEQREISKSLLVFLEKIDFSISQCNKMISLLQERKQIIINDVVTGKVKVV